MSQFECIISSQYILASTPLTGAIKLKQFLSFRTKFVISRRNYIFKSPKKFVDLYNHIFLANQKKCFLEEGQYLEIKKQVKKQAHYLIFDKILLCYLSLTDYKKCFLEEYFPKKLKYCSRIEADTLVNISDLINF